MLLWIWCLLTVFFGIRLLDKDPLRFATATVSWIFNLVFHLGELFLWGATWSQVQGQKTKRSWRCFSCLLSLTLIYITTHISDWGEGCAVSMDSMRTTSVVKKHGQEPDSVYGPSHYAKSVCKRSFLRAQRRIHKFGFTWYKGKLLTNATDFPSNSTSQTKAPRVVSTPAPPRQRMTCLTWNAGGLSPARWDMLQLWLEMQPLDIICIQETRWPYVREWQSAHYHCIHSGIPGRQAGLMCLISKRLCPAEQISWNIVDPGRILHIRIYGKQRNIDILNVYQHVHTTEHLETRQHFWDRLNDQLTILPTRNILLLMGDFNTSLLHRSNAVGMGTFLGHGRQMAGTRHSDTDQFHQLLRQHSIVALNTWQTSLGPTYVHPNAQSRIDFICCRRRHVDSISKQTHQVLTFPLNLESNTHHIPLLTSVIRCWFPAQPSRMGWSHQQRLRLYEHWKHQDEFAHQLQTAVQSRLERLPPSASPLPVLHDGLNQFPPTCTSKTITSPGYRQLLTPFQAFQHHGRAARALAGSSTLNIFQIWYHLTHMMKARKTMNLSAKMVRKQKLQEIYDHAADAAHAKDHFRLYQAVRKLAPKQNFQRIQLRNSDGSLSDPAQAADLLSTWFEQLYADEARDTSFTPFVWPFSMSSFAQGLLRLPLMKSLAPQYAPAPFWHMCTDAVTNFLDPWFHQWCWDGDFPIEWSKGHLTLLPKPGRRCTMPSDLRPIALLEPTGKVVLGLLSQTLLQESWWLLQTLPQFAYLPDRSCYDAILKVLTHCFEVRQRINSYRYRHHLAASGTSLPTLFGGLLLSLDLSRAFDEVNRGKLFHSLHEIGITPALVTLLHQIYQNTTFEFCHRGHHRTVPTFKGIRQGCKCAPILWCIFCADILTQFAAMTSWRTLLEILTVYADDFCQHQTFTSLESFEHALRNAGKLMDLLEQNGLKINTTKTVVLCRYIGRQAAQLTKRYILRTQGKTFLKIPRSDGTWTHLQLVKEYSYLGIKLSYGTFETLTMTHRLAAADRTHATLHRWLHVQPGLTSRHRVQLWRQCVFSCMTHGLFHTGFAVSDLLLLHRKCLTQLRRIYKQPVYATRETHTAFLQRMRLDGPLDLLWKLCHQTWRREISRTQHLSMDDVLHQIPKPRFEQLLQVIEAALVQSRSDLRLTQPDDLSPSLECPDCLQTFTSFSQLRRHQTKAHGHFRGQLRQIAVGDMTNGLPTCSRCLQHFTTWHAFRQHVQFVCADTLHQEPEHDETEHEHRLRVAEFMQFSNGANFQALCEQPALLAYFLNHCILCGKFHLSAKALLHHWTLDHAEVYQNHGPALETIKQVYQVTSPCILCGQQFRQQHHCIILGQAAMHATFRIPQYRRIKGHPQCSSPATYVARPM